jgi:hypothetical protein
MKPALWWNGLRAALRRVRPAEVGRATRFQWALAWRHRRLGRTLLAAAIPVLLAIVGAVLVRTGWVPLRGSEALGQLVLAVHIHILLVVIPLQFGTGLIAQEEEARTLPFLLVRPLSRGSLLVGKFLGAWLAACVMLVASLVVSAALLLGADGFEGAAAWAGYLPRLAVLLIVGALAYGVLFTLVGLLAARPALVGVFLAFGWENALAYLPGWIKLLTIRHHLTGLLPRAAVPGASWIAIDPPSAWAGTATLILAALGGLVAATLIFGRRDCP